MANNQTRQEGSEMTMQEFVVQNREAIDVVIRRAIPNLRINDVERRAWVENDEGLYLWAKQEGINI